MSSKKGKFYRNPDEPVEEQPETCDELLHKYGTYEIQPTSESGNEFPKIAAGLPSEEKQKGRSRSNTGKS